MEPQELTELADRLHVALTYELDAKLKVEDAEYEAERSKVSVLVAALAEGKIDGENASARSLQEAQVLIDDEAYQGDLVDVRRAKDTAVENEVVRRHIEARISLVRAWLYAQRPDL